jgi:DNA-binding transcriptional regulator YiaG
MIKNSIFANAETSDWLTQSLTAEEIAETRIRAQIAMVLQDFRREHEYSQKDLAKLLGITQGLLSRWENAEENLTINTLARISLVTGAVVTVNAPDKIAI